MIRRAINPLLYARIDCNRSDRDSVLHGAQWMSATGKARIAVGKVWQAQVGEPWQLGQAELNVIDARQAETQKQPKKWVVCIRKRRTASGSNASCAWK